MKRKKVWGVFIWERGRWRLSAVGYFPTRRGAQRVADGMGRHSHWSGFRPRYTVIAIEIRWPERWERP